MVSVNLLPIAIVESRRRRARVRMWVSIGAFVAALAAIPLTVDLTKTATASSLESRLKPLQSRLDRVRRELKETTSVCEELTTQLARADELRSKRPWADLLKLIRARTPDAVWLTALTTRAAPPRRPVETPAAAPNVTKPAEAVTLAGPNGIHLEGYALDHEWLYEFMSALKESGAFQQVELSSATKEPVLTGMAVRFALDCNW